MERYSMSLGRKNQYCESDHITKRNLQIQCDPYQITNDIFHRTRTTKKISQFIWKHKRHQIIKAVLRNKQTNKEKKGAGRKTFLTSDYITKLQSSKQYGMAQKQKYRPTKQDREPRNKPMHLWLPYFLQRRQGNTMGERQPLQ